jgi:hypothetical protein
VFFSFFGLFVGFSDGCFTGRDAFTIFLELFLVAEAQAYWRTSKIIRIAYCSLEIALVAPVDEF